MFEYVKQNHKFTQQMETLSILFHWRHNIYDTTESIHRYYGITGLNSMVKINSANMKSN